MVELDLNRFNDRLKYIRIGTGKTGSELADLIFVGRPNYYNAEKGTRKLPDQAIQKITELFPQVTYEWLKLGKGLLPAFGEDLPAISDKMGENVTISNTLRGRIELLMKKNRISPYKMEQKGFSRTTLRAIESEGLGRMPRIDTVKSLAEILGTTVSYLIGETDEIVQENHAKRNIVGGFSFNEIPIYDMSFNAGIALRLKEARKHANVIALLSEQYFPELKGSETIIRAKGDSMTGLIEDGDYLGITRVVDTSVIVFGAVYGIVTDELAIIKYLRRGINDDEYRICSENTDKYDDFLLLKSKITELYLVKCAIPAIKVKMFI